MHKSGDLSGAPAQIAVLMTCHNRRETTVACLQALAGQQGLHARLLLFVTDDGSTDGTAEAIREAWPEATIIQGTGKLYWAAGMALAERTAVQIEHDYLLWLNDDTVLQDGALQTLLETSSVHPDAIIVGATTDPLTGESTYGGRVRLDYHPQRLQRLPIAERPQRADTFNGNVALIPRSVRRKVGPIDGQFPHAYADDDYGLRATSLGIPVVQAPGAVADCPRYKPGAAPSGGPLRRWRQLQEPRAMPLRAQARYLRRHGDWRWPLILVGQQVQRLAGKP